ncbi:MAG: amino acid ABC transporter permease [Deferribacterales bacterium]
MTSKTKNLIWNGLLVVFLFLLGFGIYGASVKIDYTWRWERLPKYIFYTDSQTTAAPVDGTVTIEGSKLSIVPAERGDAVSFEGLDGIKVKNGDTVTKGSTLAETSSTKAGPLVVGLFTTLYISFFAIIFAIILGIVTGLARVSGNPFFKKLSVLYIELIRGTPLLVQIFIFYFFIGTILNLDRVTAGIAALSVFTGAYIAEIVRAGIQSISRGQMEAARSLGMSYTQAMALVILPQAFKRTLPPMAGQFISLIKDSSLVSVISITDLTKAGREVVASTFSPFEVWFTVAALYLILTSGLSFFVQLLEKRMAAQDR